MLQALKNELLNDPAGLGYAPHVASRNDAALADLLNAPAGTRYAETFVTARALMARVVGGADILAALEAAAAQIPAVKYAFKFMEQSGPDAGIDVGHPVTQAMLDQLVAGNVLTAAQAASIKALAERPSSRAYALFGKPVSATDVSAALN